MRAMGEYLHALGLLYGLYTSAGTKTCQGSLPGSLGYEERDAQTFSDWGVDYLKYDNCFNENIPSVDRYSKMRDALNKTGRPIFYSLCQWGVENVWNWAPAVGNSWRSTPDISPHWNSIKANFLANQEHNTFFRSQPGSWADPDMLEVGNGNLTSDEERTHFSLWALVKAPLLLGMDLSSITDETLHTISNKNLIRVNQDPKARPATCFFGCGDHNHNNNESWSAYATVVTGGDTVAIIVNWRDDSELTNVTFGGQDVGVVPSKSQVVYVTDLWTNRELGTFDFRQVKSLPIPSIPPHGCVVYQFSVKTSNALDAHGGTNDDGLIAHVPPMGWNSWNNFGCSRVNEQVIRDAVRVLAYSGLQQLGYRYVNIDDCWMAANRTLVSNEYQADPTKFPSGMKEIGIHIHKHGLLYGLYTSAGTKTCQGLPGSLGSEERDAQTFADWGVDFLKYDNCYNENIPSIDRYPKMRDALNKTGRPIFYSLCQWGTCVS
jgi:alpha-galactosidase